MCNFWEKKLKALFEKTGKKRDKLAGALAIVISIALGLGTITVILILVLPEVFNSITGIVKVIPTSIDQFSSWVLQYVGDNELLKNYVEQLSGGMSNTVSNWIRTTLLPGLQTILDGFSNSVVNLLTICYNFFIGIIVSIYLLASRRTFSIQWKMMLYSVCGRKLSAMIQKELEYADHVFGGFMTGKLVDVYKRQVLTWSPSISLKDGSVVLPQEGPSVYDASRKPGADYGDTDDGDTDLSLIHIL